jgi:hypothetical protein
MTPTLAWGCDDYTMLSWIYGSISPELLGIVMHPGSTTRTIWDTIENLFRDNKKHRAIQLAAGFHNTPQADLSINDYYAKIKNLTDLLTDVDQPISDETLVLTLLRGLNDTYAHLHLFLPFQVPFPTFLQTRSALILEETQWHTDARNAASTVLWAMGQSVLPTQGAIVPLPPLEIAPRLPLPGANALVGAATATSSTTFVAAAVSVAVAADAVAVAALRGSSTLGLVRPYVHISSRGRDSLHMRRPGSRAPRNPGRRRHLVF